jgi:hypothetical protein
MKAMSVDEFMKAVDHAAGMSDHWLFIASLVVIGLFGIWVVRYFVKQHERLLDDHRQSRECYQKSLQGVVAEQSAMNAKLVVCLEANTKVLGQCRDELRRRSRRSASQNKQQTKGCKA